MQAAFKIWTINRHIYLSFLEQFSIDQLNSTPFGFSNNIIWNIGHIIVAQQRLVYKASNLSMNVSDEYFERYKPGTKPSRATEIEIEKLKFLLLSLMEATITDFYDGKFTSFSELTTGSGFHLASINDAIQYNNYHEGLHLGYMMNIKKFI